MTEQVKSQNDREKRLKAMEANREAMQNLINAYPEIFSLEIAKPLKIGIHEDLAGDGKMSKTKIRKALATYVRQIAYYKCLVQDADRVDLTGAPVSKVTEDEAAYATEKLAAIDAKRKQKQVARKKANGQKNRIDSKLQALINKPGQR